MKTKPFETLEVGKLYRGRSGHISRIEKTSSDLEYPFVDDIGQKYTGSGEFYSGLIDHRDLIQEVVSWDDESPSEEEGKLVLDLISRRVTISAFNSKIILKDKGSIKELRDGLDAAYNLIDLWEKSPWGENDQV